MKYSQLQLVERHILMPLADTRVIKIRRKLPDHEIHRFKDFVIDEKSVFKSIAGNNSTDPNLSTVLHSEFPRDGQEKYINMLLGREPGDCAQGRVALYVCPWDGDLYCGAVACKVSFTTNAVRWDDFYWVDGEDDNALTDEDKVDGLTSYTFDRSEYEATLLSAAESIKQFHTFSTKAIGQRSINKTNG